MVIKFFCLFLFYLFLVKNKLSLRVTKRLFVGFCFVLHYRKHFVVILEFAWLNFVTISVKSTTGSEQRFEALNDFPVTHGVSPKIHNDIKKVTSKKVKLLFAQDKPLTSSALFQFCKTAMGNLFRFRFQCCN